MTFALASCFPDEGKRKKRTRHRGECIEDFPWLGTATVIGWTPQTFWKSTLIEFFAAIEGWNRVHGEAPESAPMTHDEYDDLLAEYGGPSGSIKGGGVK